jgi:phosphoserine aminotransferase
MSRSFNFNPGPSTLPLSALQIAQQELLDYRGTGMSILETSHRSKEFKTIHDDTKSLLRELLGIPEDYAILFLGGGASLQFAMIAMNFIPKKKSAGYVVTGAWAKKALQEANIIAKGNVAASTESENFGRIPESSELNLDPQAAYLHLTSNNTIFGTQWHHFPKTGSTPLIADMSSDILSRKINVADFDMIYAGAQKNLGPAGVTIIILKQNLADKANSDLPTMLSFKTHIEKDSLFNTPPVYAIYVTKLVLDWILQQGGVKAIEKQNNEKAELLYSCIDQSDGFYRGTASKDSRSKMNATFRLANEDLEKEFLAKALDHELKGLKGHRSVGGIRVSMYNAMPVQGIERLVNFMKTFQTNHQ